jgi:cytochrome P450
MYESLRMYSPVEAVPKMAVGDQILGDYVLPSTTNISLHTFFVQYSEEHWKPDPFVFRPERWFADPECAKSARICYDRTSDTTLKSFFKYSRYAFIAFSDGPRSCLGRRFAEVEFMTAVVILVKSLEFKAPPGISAEELLKSKVTITYRPSQPVELFLSPRTEK